MEALRAPAAEEIAAVEGVGPVIAEAVAGWLWTRSTPGWCGRSRRRGSNERPRRERPDGPLSGAVVVVTGSIEGYTRDWIREHLESLGAKVTDSISKKTDYLVAGEGGGSKRAKAEKLGVAVVTLEELEAELGDRASA